MATLFSPHSWISGHKQHVDDKDRRRRNALKCLRLISEAVPMNSVVDFGCGIGAWLSAARELGATETLGIEGEWIRQADAVIPQDQIQIADLSKEWPHFEKRFDLAMSIEVAEHLPESAARSFTKALTNASDYVLFSAATPGQGGLGHINEQYIDYWIDFFWNKRFVPLDPIRPFVSTHLDIYPWLRQNLILFVSYTEFLRNEKLLRFARPISEIQRRYKARQA